MPRTGQAAVRRTRPDGIRRRSRGSDRLRGCRGATSGTTAACGECQANPSSDKSHQRTPKCPLPTAAPPPLAERGLGVRGWNGVSDIAILHRQVSALRDRSQKVMRPTLLDRLFVPVTVLPGVGPQLARLLERAAGPLVVDLLWHLPIGLIDRRAAPSIGALNPRDWPDAIVTLKVRVERHETGFGRRPSRVYCGDGTGTLVLVYFNVKGDQLHRMLPVGAERVISGRVEYYGGLPQIAHPDYVVAPEAAEQLKAIEPVYPLTAGLSPRIVQRAVAAAPERAPGLPGWLPPPVGGPPP